MTVKIQDPELAVKDSRGTHAPCRHQSTSDIFLTLFLCFSWTVWRLPRWHFIAQPLQHKDIVLHDHDTVINPNLVCGKTSPSHSCLLQLTCSNQGLRMGRSLSLSLAVLKLSYLVQADLELTLLSTGMDRRAADSHHRFPLLLCTDVPTLPFSDSLDLSKKKIRSKSLVRMKSGTLGTNMSQAVVLWTGGARQPLAPLPAELKVLASWKHFLLSPHESSGNILAPGEYQSLLIMALALLIFLSLVSWPY